MKLGLYSDIHASKNDCLINEHNSHNTAESILWARETFKKEGCELIVNDGDFLDSTIIDPETNYIIKKVFDGNAQREILLCGNHEIKDKDAKYNSLNILDNFPLIEVCNSLKTLKVGETTLVFQPFSSKKEDMKILSDTLDKIQGKKILFSHLTYNNIPNVALSEKIVGEIDYRMIAPKVDLIFNGHIHNALESDKYVQCGVLSGLNFGDDYTFHKPGIIILDTDTLEYKRIENPLTILYVKASYDNLPTEDEERTYLRVSCPAGKVDEIQAKLEKSKYFRYKLKIISEAVDGETEEKQEISLYNDPMRALKDYIQTEKGIYTEKELNDFIDNYYK